MRLRVLCIYLPDGNNSAEVKQVNNLIQLTHYMYLE